MGLTQTFRGTATIEFPTTHTIYNVLTSSTPSTETSQLLTSITKQLLIRVRGTANLQYSFITGESGTKFITVPKNSTRVITDIDVTGTIYFQVDKASQVVEIEEWST